MKKRTSSNTEEYILEVEIIEQSDKDIKINVIIERDKYKHCTYYKRELIIWKKDLYIYSHIYIWH